MTKSSGWGAYIDAVLRIETPGGVIWVRPAPLSRTSGEYPDPEGRTICVITAHNPAGRLASRTENDSAQAELVAELKRLGLTWWPAVGGDPSWTHVEASAAVIGIAEANAIALGARFGQDAIFVLTPAERLIVGCAEKRWVASGWSIRPEAGHYEDPGDPEMGDAEEDEDDPEEGPDTDLVARTDSGAWPPRSGEPESPESGR
jgi:hypothetical protein